MSEKSSYEFSALPGISNQFTVKLIWNDRLSFYFESKTNYQDWTIHISLHPALKKIRLETSTLDNLVTTLFRHEMGHWKICPFDGQDHLHITASVTAAYRKMVKNRSYPKILCALISDLFEDLIVDRFYSTEEDYRKGIGLIIELIKNSSKKYDTLGGILMSLKEAFILGHKANDKIHHILEPLIKGTIKNRNQWSKMAYEFSCRFFSYIIEENISGELNERAVDNIYKNLVSKSLISARMEQDEYYRDNMIKVFIRNAAVQGQPIFSNVCCKDTIEYFDYVYQFLAENIRLKIINSKSSTQILTYLGKLSLGNDELPIISKMKWASTLLYEQSSGEIFKFFKKEIPFNIPGERDKDNGPCDLALILDSSRSMGLINNPVSWYSLLLQAVYSLLNYIRITDNDIYMRFCMINFSHETWYSGWRESFELKQLRYRYLLKTQNSRSVLNPVALNEMTMNAERPFISLMITDGELDNPDEVIKEVVNLMEQGNDYCLIKIGMEGDNFTESIKRCGAEVHVVHRAEDLIGLILNKGLERWK